MDQAKLNELRDEMMGLANTYKEYGGDSRQYMHDADRREYIKAAMLIDIASTLAGIFENLGETEEEN